MSWLYWVGFKYDGELYDTMIAEYILQRGNKFDKFHKRISLSLKESCIRNNLPVKSDILSNYTNDGFNIDEIPMKELEEYGRKDVEITYKLYKAQAFNYNKQHNKKLIPVRVMSNRFLKVIIDMEMNGNCLDLDCLSKVEKDLTEQYYKHKNHIDNITKEVMG